MATDPLTLGWIFYAVAATSRRAPVSRTDISAAADAINHAVPTQQELNGALHRLAALGLVESRGKFHALTPSGLAMIESAHAGRSTMMAVWDELTRRFTEMANTGEP